MAAQVIRHNVSASLSRIQTEREDFKGFNMREDKGGLAVCFCFVFLSGPRVTCSLQTYVYNVKRHIYKPQLIQMYGTDKKVYIMPNMLTKTINQRMLN